MSDFEVGDRVTYTDVNGIIFNGSVESLRRGGWVMVELDEPITTPARWQTSRMMLRDTALSEIPEV